MTRSARPANVDAPETAAALVRHLHGVADLADLVIPVHPRGRANLLAAGLDEHAGVHILEPLGYIDFIAAVRGAAAVVTDSGGLQEETTILGVPCLTVRPNTERPITITHGTNRLVSFEEVVPGVRKILDGGSGGSGGSSPLSDTESGAREGDRKPPLWDGHAGPRIAEVIMEYLSD
jgi:UDP-N-acetylglucosamine 2-epimerase (non-hydrolysing)